MNQLFTSSRFHWLKDARCLVTGGAGFIGSHLVRSLCQVGAHVTVLDDLSTGNRANLAGSDIQDIEVIEGSITDVPLLRSAVNGRNYVFHLAAIPAVPRSIAEPIETAWANIWGTQLVLEEARRAGVLRVIFSASSSAYGDTAGDGPRSEDLLPRPLSPYAAHKLASEHLMRAYGRSMGLQTVSLRYFNIFGPRQNPDSPYSAVIPLFMRAAIQGKPITVHGDGSQSRDFTYVDNAVLANMLASRPDLRLEGEVFNVGCGDSFSLMTLVNEVEKLSGRPLEVRHTEPRSGDVHFSLANISRIRTCLGYEPVVNFHDGLRYTFESLCKVSRTSPT